MKGTIRPRGHTDDGRPRWLLQVSLGTDETGAKRYKTKTVYGSRTSAETELARLVVDVADGVIVSPRGYTVGDWLDEWLEKNRARGRWVHGTYAKHEGNVRLYIKPHLGRVKLDELKPAQIDRAYAKLAGQLAPVTRRMVHRTLSQALKDAVRLDVLGRNPCDRVHAPHVPTDDEVGAPTDEQVAGFLELVEAAGPIWHAWFRLAAYTGARPGELAALRWNRVELTSSPQIVLDNTTAVAEAGGYEPRGRPKRGKGRPVSLDDTTAAVLARWRDEQAAIAKRAGSRLHPTWWVFPKWHVPGHPEPMPPGAPARRWAELRSLVGIGPELGPYSLRHWHASWLLRNGVGLNVVAHRIGHAQPTLTANVYGRHVPAGDRSVAELIGRLELASSG